MRRPLLFWCFLAVMILSLLYYGGAIGEAKAPPDGQIITVTGKIYQKNETSFYLTIQTNAADLRQSEQFQKADSLQISQDHSLAGNKIICDFDGAGQLELGSIVTVRGTFCTFSRATNPGEFDYDRYYRSSKIIGRLREMEVTLQRAPLFGWRECLYKLRCYWEGRLYRIFPEKEASVMAAILLGNKSDVDSDVKELYRKAGIIHILSISGLHITLIGMGIYRLLRRVGVPVWAAAVSGALLLILYGVMTGLGMSSCRAIGMYLFRMLAQLCGRTYDMLTALGVTAVVLLAGNPAYLENMGFLLSFGSVLGVGVFFPAIAPDREEERRRKRRYVEGRCRRIAAELVWKIRIGLLQGILAGGSVTMATLPVQLWFSYEVPVYSVVLNVMILPFMSIVMIAGMIAVMVPGLGIVGTADVLILAWYEKVCTVFERLPFHAWNPGRPAIWQIAVYYLLWVLLISATTYYRRRRKRRSAAIGLRGVLGEHGAEGLGSVLGISAVSGKKVDGRDKDGKSVDGRRNFEKEIWEKRVMQIGKLLILTASVMILGIPLPHGDRVTFLDVGQGDCICVQLSSGEVYLFDCGSSSRKGIGEKVLIPFLKYYGIRRVDAVLLSHADTDHINGILELLKLGEQEHITVGQVVLPGIDRKLWQEEFGELLATVGIGDAPVSVIRAGENWTAGESGHATTNQAGQRKTGAENADSFLCLHPDVSGQSSGGNEGSACFYIELHEGGNEISLLLTGDVDGAGEAQLLSELRNRDISDVTLLKIAHHGSRNSTSEELLEQISPEVAIISCGRKNRYGHPHRELLERVEDVGAVTLRTDESGAIQLWLDGKQARIEGYLERQ